MNRLPDRWAIIPGVHDYHVDLNRGLFRDEIRVWADVRPAAGGLIGSGRVRHRDADRLFDECVSNMVAAVGHDATVGTR